MKKQKELKTNLAMIMHEQGRTQTWLADQIGKSVTTINAYCQGNRKMDHPTLLLCASLLDIETSKLID